jgi:hypothetical protein
MPGFAEMCMSGHHESCTDHQCRCGCHSWVRELIKAPIIQKPAGIGNLVCPTCDRIPKAGDAFCRNDGSRLIAGKTCSCGKPGAPDDVYCGSCGAKFGLPPLPALELSEEEIAAIEAKARMRPSDVEAPVSEVH